MIWRERSGNDVAWKYRTALYASNTASTNAGERRTSRQACSTRIPQRVTSHAPHNSARVAARATHLARLHTRSGQVDMRRGLVRHRGSSRQKAPLHDFRYGVHHGTQQLYNMVAQQPVWRASCHRELFSHKRRCVVHSIASHRAASHHITSHHITSHHITSHHITSHHITSHHITSWWLQSSWRGQRAWRWTLRRVCQWV
jgi:hypothetical protein